MIPSPQKKHRRAILAVDVGTSAVRVVLFDDNGREIPAGDIRRPVNVASSVQGAAEVDADRLLDRVWECIDDGVRWAIDNRLKIMAVAVTTFAASIIGIDQEGIAQTPLVTYADTRSREEVSRLRLTVDEADVRDRTGCCFHTSYLPAFFCWLTRTRPALVRRIARWISIGEYMELALFGQTAVSYSVASWSGLLNRRELTWDKALLSVLPVKTDQLSPLTDIDQARHGLLPRFARRWEKLAAVAWFPTVADGAAANIGSGCHDPSRVAITIGSSSAVRIVTSDPVENVPPGLWCYRMDRCRSLVGGALNEGGSLFGWMNATLDLGSSDHNMDQALATMAPDAHGLTVLPFFSGERSPGWAGYARATLHGLSLATTPIDVLRAGLESVAYRIGEVYKRLVPLIPGRAEIVASGGAVRRSPVWAQILADVLDRPVVVSGTRESSCQGAALLALVNLGLLPGLDTPTLPPGKKYLPDRKHHAVYQKAIVRQQRLYDRLVANSFLNPQDHITNRYQP
jgi:gluconokinase